MDTLYSASQHNSFHIFFQIVVSNLEPKHSRGCMTMAPCCSKWEGLPIPMPNLVTNMPRATPPHSFWKSVWSSRCLLHILSHLVTPKISSKMSRFWPDRKLKGYQNTDYNVLRKKQHVFRIRSCYSMEPTVVFSFASFFETGNTVKPRGSNLPPHRTWRSIFRTKAGLWRSVASGKFCAVVVSKPAIHLKKDVLVNFGSLPQVGLNMTKHIWSHHLVCCCHQINMKHTFFKPSALSGWML